MTPASWRAVEARFAAAGLTAKYIATPDPDIEDDEIEVYRDGVDTRVTIQVALIGGGYYVNEWQASTIPGSTGDDSVMVHRGYFRALGKAVGCAIETVAAKDRAA